MTRKTHSIFIIVLMFVLVSVKVYAHENASNPLSAVSNTDLRAQFFDLGDANLNEYWVDGDYMATPKLKLKYELHYWNSDLSGSWQSGFQSIHFKPVYFPLQGKWGSWKYKLAVGLEWILEFNAPITQGCPEYPISCLPGFTGSDQIAPFVGLSLVIPKGTLLIPLVQQFVSYNGTKVNMTAMRLIAIQSLPKSFWGKLDFIVPIDWKNEVVPATAEVQLGKMFSPTIGTYVDGMFGIGGDRPYEWGVGVGSPVQLLIMKKIFTFIKDRIITGMLVIIPILVIGVILTDVIKKLIAITTPLSSKMSFAGPLIESIVAGIILVILLGAFFFISGVFFKSYLGNSFENWLERKVLEHIPFYQTVKGVTRQITGVEKGNYAVVEVDLYGNTNKVLGLLTETLSDGRCVVYIPFAPFINIGQVHIIAKENMKKLDISLKEANEIISRFGFEAGKVYKK